MSSVWWTFGDLNWYRKYRLNRGNGTGGKFTLQIVRHRSELHILFERQCIGLYKPWPRLTSLKKYLKWPDCPRRIPSNSLNRFSKFWRAHSKPATRSRSPVLGILSSKRNPTGAAGIRRPAKKSLFRLGECWHSNQANSWNRLSTNSRMCGRFTLPPTQPPLHSRTVALRNLSRIS